MEFVDNIEINEISGKNILIIHPVLRKKLEIDPNSKCKAKDLHQGKLFKLVRRLCEINGWNYLILSAKYGLIGPEDEINYYDKTIKSSNDIDRLKRINKR